MYYIGLICQCPNLFLFSFRLCIYILLSQSRLNIWLKVIEYGVLKKDLVYKYYFMQISHLYIQPSLHFYILFLDFICFEIPHHNIHISINTK